MPAEGQPAEQGRRLATLYAILETIRNGSDLHATLADALARILETTAVSAGAIFVLNPRTQQLQRIAEKGLSPALVSVCNKFAIQNPFSKIKADSFLMLSDLAAWTEDNQPLSYSAILTTISKDTNPVGGLVLFAKDVTPLQSKQEQSLLRAIADQLGMVIETVQLRQQAEKLMILQERNRLARDLHDSVTQSLYSVTLFAEAGRNLTSQQAYERACRYFDDVLETSQQALREMRLLVHKLRPSVLTQEGLVRALQQRLNAVEGRAGIKHEFVVEGAIDLPPEMEEALFHIAQEALNNGIKHAAATEVQVLLRQEEDAVFLRVSDNGRGFDLAAAVESGGLGLTSMRERVANVNGEIAIETAIGRGTAVAVRLSYAATEEDR